jgi:5-formyltetrahydrofolate cyclo-ligase
MPKAMLRKSLLARRLALPAPEKTIADAAIQAAFLAMPEYSAAASVAVYCAANNEVSTEKVIAHALSAGKELILPAVEGNAMIFRRINSVHDLIQGSFGIRQPSADCVATDPATIDVIVVPGVGFDLAGQRIGYGKGYYDRTLHRLEGGGKLIAFCYELQLVDSLAGEQHDVSMDRIITERRIIIPALI